MRVPALKSIVLITLVALSLGAHAFDSGTQDLLTQALDDIVETEGLVGAAAGIRVNGNLRALAAAGHRTKARKSQVTTDDLWHTGSITKSMTALLIGSMMEREEIRLEDTVAEVLPERAKAMDPGWHGITVHQLLTHTSGAPGSFGPFLTFVGIPAKAAEARVAALDSIMQSPPQAEPGSAFAYSNLGYTLAGHLAEVRLGIPWYQAVQQRVFEPLGLESPGFGPPQGDQPVGHANLMGFKRTAPRRGLGSDNSMIMAPAGLVHMSITDLLRYGQAHLDGARGKDGLLKAATIQKLHEPRMDDYAAGMVVMQRESAGGRILWHNGSNTQWYALLIIAPEKNAVVALATNDGAIKKAEPAFFMLADQLLETLP
ncbi:MAG: serine hydrolase domain-containing protein [Xanthomonadales bacterium]|nr:serine hydrolase domain-containing protein [Xanthomonadales bacterium]